MLLATRAPGTGHQVLAGPQSPITAEAA